MVLSRVLCWAPRLDTFQKGFRFFQGLFSGTQVWSDEMVDLIWLAAPFALFAFLLLVALPFSERLCPWLAALFSDAFLMPPDATLFIGWIFQLGYGFVARDCFQHLCGGVALLLMGFAPAAAEDEFGFESDASGPVAGAGAENELRSNVSETTGPVAGTRVENELPDHESGFVNDFLEEVASRGQVRRHAHPDGIGHAPLFQQTEEDKKVLSGDFGE